MKQQQQTFGANPVQQKNPARVGGASRMARRADADTSPWYAQRWPWLLMVGPVAVVLAGIVTIWLAVNFQDALVVDDYYKQGRAINQDLRRDRTATSLQMQAKLNYDAETGALRGRVAGDAAARSGGLVMRLVHSTLPEKDLLLHVRPDADGRFSAALPMLDVARWQVIMENDARDWRLLGTWQWPRERQLIMKADVAHPTVQGR